MTPIIRVANLEKTFEITERRKGLTGALRNLVSPVRRTVRAVDGVSFTLQEGELVGYLGPNGAGKSTTMKVLTGLLVPSGGEVMVDGFVPWKQRARYVARIGAVFGQRTSLWWDLPLIDSFEMLQPMYRIAPEQYRKNLDEFRELLELDEFLQSPVRSLSLGQRMRAELCAALLHEPRLLFLDEPTIGLDVVAKERIRQFILFVNRERGTTVILTTHDLSDVERLCERVMILDRGHLLYDGRLALLVERFEQQRRLVVTLSGDCEDVSVDGLSVIARQGVQVTYAFDPHRLPAPEALQRVIARLPVADLEVRRPELEDSIRRIYEQKLLHESDAANE